MPRILSKSQLVKAIKNNCHILRDDGGIDLCYSIGRHIHFYCELDGGYGSASIKKLHKIIGGTYSMAALHLFRGFYRDWPKQLREKAITADLKYRYLSHFAPLIRLLNNLQASNSSDVAKVDQFITHLIEKSGKKGFRVTTIPEQIEEFLLKNHPESMGRLWLKKLANTRRDKVISLLKQLKFASKKLAVVDARFECERFLDLIGHAGETLC